MSHENTLEKLKSEIESINTLHFQVTLKLKFSCEQRTSGTSQGDHKTQAAGLDRQSWNGNKSHICKMNEKITFNRIARHLSLRVAGDV